MSISSTIKSIQDIMRKDVGVDGDAQRIGQLVWMFFLKIYDDKETEYELLDDDYRSPIPEPFRWRNWAANPEGMTGDELLDFINNQLFPSLKDLTPAGEHKRGYVIRSVFEDAYNYMKSGHLMRQVINKIVEGLDFNKAQDRHLFGDLYEQILRDLQNAGNAGEYYTPRPSPSSWSTWWPRSSARRSGPGLRHRRLSDLRHRNVRKQHVKTVEQEQQLQASIYGVEKKPLPHLLCTTNMILHGIDVPTNVRHDNTWPAADYGPRDRVDVIVTNPPFGGMEEDGIETTSPPLPHPRNRRPLPGADHAPAQGRRPRRRGAARRLPVRRRHQDAHQGKAAQTATCTPSSAQRRLQPHTGIKTNLLFFTKGTPTTEIWFYEHPYPPATRTIPRPSRCASRNSRPKRPGGEGLREASVSKRIRLEGQRRRHQGAQLQPRHQEPHSPIRSTTTRRTAGRLRPVAAAHRRHPRPVEGRAGGCAGGQGVSVV
jgi:type I restriction enzyme M protein